MGSPLIFYFANALLLTTGGQLEYIMNKGIAKLIQTLITIKAYSNPLESIGVLVLERYKLRWDPLTIEANWSSLELENMKTGMAKLIHMVITIGAHWSPLELQI